MFKPDPFHWEACINSRLVSDNYKSSFVETSMKENCCRYFFLHMLKKERNHLACGEKEHRKCWTGWKVGPNWSHVVFTKEPQTASSRLTTHNLQIRFLGYKIPLLQHLFIQMIPSRFTDVDDKIWPPKIYFLDPSEPMSEIRGTPEQKIFTGHRREVISDEKKQFLF